MKHLKAAILFAIFAVFFIVPQASNAAGFLLDGMLAKGSGPEVYFMENGMKRWIVDPDAFFAFDFNWRNVRFVPDTLLESYPRGQNLDKKSAFPNSMLVKLADDPKVYITDRSSRRWIKDPDTFNNLGLDWYSVNIISEEKMKKIREGTVMEQTSRMKRPSTIFTKTPDEKVIEDVYAEFEYNALAQGASGVVFDTFLEGMDKNWVTTSTGLRKINLPKESGKYIFYVRARFKDAYADVISQKFDFSVKISPVFESVQIAGVRASGEEYVSVANRSKIDQNITGWKIESKLTGLSYTIPDVYEVPLHPYYASRISLILPPGKSAQIFSKKSPIGQSFRLNECTGYLNKDYSLSLPAQCPRPTDDDIKNLSTYCQKQIKATPTCKEPDVNSVLLDNECRDFMRNNMTYYSCVVNERNFYNFFKDDWRIYLNGNENSWKDRNDTLLLRDINGLVVDTYKY